MITNLARTRKNLVFMIDSGAAQNTFFDETLSVEYMRKYIYTVFAALGASISTIGKGKVLFQIDSGSTMPEYFEPKLETYIVWINDIATKIKLHSTLRIN